MLFFTYSRKRSFVPQPLDQLSNSICYNMRIFLVAPGALLADIRNDSCNLFRFFWIARLEVHSGRQTETAGDTVGYRIGRADSMADAMAQAYSAGVEERKQGSVTSCEKFSANICIFWIRF